MIFPQVAKALGLHRYRNLTMQGVATAIRRMSVFLVLPILSQLHVASAAEVERAADHMMLQASVGRGRASSRTQAKAKNSKQKVTQQGLPTQGISAVQTGISMAKTVLLPEDDDDDVLAQQVPSSLERPERASDHLLLQASLQKGRTSRTSQVEAKKSVPVTGAEPSDRDAVCDAFSKDGGAPGSCQTAPARRAQAPKSKAQPASKPRGQKVGGQSWQTQGMSLINTKTTAATKTVVLLEEDEDDE